MIRYIRVEGMSRMKEIIHNHHHLEEKDITETTTRMKVLLLKDDSIYIGNTDNIYQFIGGHLEENESFQDCLKREILEETGIEVDSSKIKDPFMKVTFLSKDHPEKGKNRKAEIFYYAISVEEEPNLDKTHYTEHEKAKNFKIEKFKMTEVIDKIKENIPKHNQNKVISPDMISAIKEYQRIFLRKEKNKNG